MEDQIKFNIISQDRVTFLQTFPTGQFSNQKLQFETSLREGETEIEAYVRAHKIVNEAFNKLNPHITFTEPNHTGELPVQKVEKTSVEFIVEDVLACKDLATLDTYRLIAKTSPAVDEAYQKRLKELSQ